MTTRRQTLRAALLLLAIASARGAFGQVAPPRIREVTGKLPLAFEPNRGQADDAVQFLSRSEGHTLYLVSDEVVTVRHGGVVRLKLIGAAPNAAAEGSDLLPGHSNYFLGNEPSKWHKNLPHYGKVRFRSVYPGIDLVYYGSDGSLEYDFIVEPGVDPGTIRMKLEGTDGLTIDGDGDLVWKTGSGEMRLRKPRLYQERKGERTEVRGGFRLDASRSAVRFRVGNYDESLPLVIDPVLAYSTYLGGKAGEACDAVAIDPAGNVIVSGTTASDDFPTVNAYQPNIGGPVTDAFVTKYTPDGQALVWSTYLGGVGTFDDAYALAVDPQGNVYIAGDTNSINFPVVFAYQPFYAGHTDAYLAKLSADGSELLYSTFFGGAEAADLADAIALDATGNIYLTGYTNSVDFPTKDPLQPYHLGGYYDAWVAKFAPSGSLVFSTFLGGTGSDQARGIVLDRDNNVVVAGVTFSEDFPVTANALQPVWNGLGGDFFITKIAADGRSLLYSTFLGGSSTEDTFSLKMIDLDAAGNIFIAGNTFSNDIPLVNAIQTTQQGESDAYVAKLTPDGSAIVFATLVGGTAYDDGYAIRVDAWGNAHVTGKTISPGFPTKNAIQPIHGGFDDAFLMEFNPTGGLIHSTYLGGSGPDRGNAIAFDGAGDLWLAGQAGSSNFPTVNPQQPRRKGTQDGFVAKVVLDKPPEEVLSLSWADAVTLQWSAAARADTYNVYRGDAADLPKLLDTRVDSCLLLSTPNLVSGPVLTEDPAAGQLEWFLVRAENTIGLGLPGSATAHPRIHDPSGTCP